MGKPKKQSKVQIFQRVWLNFLTDLSIIDPFMAREVVGICNQMSPAKVFAEFRDNTSTLSQALKWDTIAKNSTGRKHIESLAVFNGSLTDTLANVPLSEVSTSSALPEIPLNLLTGLLSGNNPLGALGNFKQEDFSKVMESLNTPENKEMVQVVEDIFKNIGTSGSSLNFETVLNQTMACVQKKVENNEIDVERLEKQAHALMANLPPEMKKMFN